MAELIKIGGSFICARSVSYCKKKKPSRLPTFELQHQAKAALPSLATFKLIAVH